METAQKCLFSQGKGTEKRCTDNEKGPFRTKNAMAPKIVVFYYYRSILLCVLICCNSPQENSIFRPFAVVNRYDRSDLASPYSDLRSVAFLAWKGPLGPFGALTMVFITITDRLKLFQN